MNIFSRLTNIFRKQVKVESKPEQKIEPKLESTKPKRRGLFSRIGNLFSKKNFEPTVVTNSEPTVVTKPEPTVVTNSEPTVVTKPEPTVVTNSEPTVVSKPEPTFVSKPEPDSRIFDRPRIYYIKKELQDIIDTANNRWIEIEKHGLSSKAIEQALADNEQVPYFGISGLEDYNDIIAEVTRARVFLNDITSTYNGALDYTLELNSLQWEGKFGNEYDSWVYNYKKYDTTVIDDDYAKVAFRVYRDLSHYIQNFISRYGSGESIQLIYEVVSENNVRNENNDDLDIIRERVMDFYENRYGGKGRAFEKEFDEENRKRESIVNKIKYTNKDLETFGNNYF